MSWTPTPAELRQELQRQREMEERLKDLPRFAAAVKNPHGRPHLTFMCPEGHSLFTVSLDGGIQGASPWLVLVTVADETILVDGWGAEDISGEGALAQTRVRVRCPQCRFERVYRHTELLERYASAVEGRKKRLRLE